MIRDDEINAELAGTTDLLRGSDTRINGHDQLCPLGCKRFYGGHGDTVPLSDPVRNIIVYLGTV